MSSLVLVGRFDGAIGLGQMRALAAHLPIACFDECAKDGHFISMPRSLGSSFTMSLVFWDMAGVVSLRLRPIAVHHHG